VSSSVKTSLRKKADGKAGGKAALLRSSPDDRLPSTLAGHRDGGAELTDVLLALSRGHEGWPIVMAGSSTEDVEKVVSALLDEAQRRSLKVLIGRHQSGERSLETELFVPWTNGSSTVSESTADVAISGTDPSQGSILKSFRSLLDRAGAGCDLVVVLAPPMCDSPDAALLAQRCQGLVLVVEPLHTTRRALKAALAKTRLVGCPVRAVVVSGGRPWIPGWFRRFLPDPPL